MSVCLSVDSGTMSDLVQHLFPPSQFQGIMFYEPLATLALLAWLAGGASALASFSIWLYLAVFYS